MNTETALNLVNTSKLTVEQMLDVGNKANDSDVWQAVVEKIREK